jgi:hypothetical protein
MYPWFSNHVISGIQVVTLFSAFTDKMMIRTIELEQSIWRIDPLQNLSDAELVERAQAGRNNLFGSVQYVNCMTVTMSLAACSKDIGPSYGG